MEENLDNISIYQYIILQQYSVGRIPDSEKLKYK
jgi:hypothetical protein